MTDWHNEMTAFAREQEMQRAEAEANGSIPETAHGSANNHARAIWRGLSERIGHQHRLPALAEQVGVGTGTVRRYVREWGAAGYVAYGSGVVRLPKGARAHPPDISLDCGGKLVYVHYPDEDIYTVVDRTAGRHAHPTITRRRRNASGPDSEVAYTDIRPGETLAQYYERKGVETARDDAGETAAAGSDPYEEWDRELGPAGAIDTSADDEAPEPPATLPAVRQGADLPALLDAGHQALAQATNNLERLRVRDGARAYQEAARVLKRTDVLVDASVLVQTAERAIAQANPAPGPAEAGARKGKAPTPTDLDVKLLRNIRSAHTHVTDAMFRALVKRAREEGEPLTRKLIARTGRVARPRDPHVTHNTGNYERLTPPEIIAAARRVMGGIDCDPASRAEANAIVCADTFYTEADDGLARPWFGRVWLNPPFRLDLVSAFTARLIDHLAEGKVDQAILLTNNSTDAAWWQGAASHALAACFPSPRVKFLLPNHRPVGTGPLQGQAVLYFSREPDDGIERFAQEFRRFGVVFYPILWDPET